jgi:hypothetical protein
MVRTDVARSRLRSGPIFLFGAAALCLSALAAAAAPADAASPACEIRAFQTDPDPNGTNIRSAPRADAPVIIRLPPRVFLDPGHSDSVGWEFAVIGSRNGWLLIKNVHWVNVPDQLWAGPGWMWGGLAGVSLRSVVLRASPRRDAPVIDQLMDLEKGWMPDSFLVSQIHGCRDKFVEVSISQPKRLRGWSREPCPAQLTTCDGTLPD